MPEEDHGGRETARPETWNERLDRYDRSACRRGLLKPASWDRALRKKTVRLYAGELFRGLPQFSTHYGLSIAAPSRRNILHDVGNPMPIPDACVDIYQSEDVLEHLSYDRLVPVIDDIFRVLKPGGLFRLSLPDYRCPIYADRTLRDAQGGLLFDPGGGGQFVEGKVVNGGHVWFPRYESVKALFDASRFSTHGSVDFLHCYGRNSEPIAKRIDYTFGHVSRTPDHDDRLGPGKPLSIVVDARKGRHASRSGP